MSDGEQSSAVTSAAKAANAYAGAGRAQQEERWILQYLPLVSHIVRKCSHAAGYHDTQDLISAGTLGLVKAARAYDPGHDAEFGTYAYLRVRGAVIDEMRRRGFAPPRALRQLEVVRQAYRRLASINGRVPDDSELAADAGLTIEQLYHVLSEARRQHFLRIHGLCDEQGQDHSLAPLDNLPSPAEQAERNDLVQRLTECLKSLPSRERQVLLLYYERDLTMKEIARVLEVTESRVSQMHASAIFRLSMRLGDQRDAVAALGARRSE